MKMKTKILYALAIAVFAIILLGTTKVNATEYISADKNTIITMNDLGLGGKTEINSSSFSSYISIKGVNQAKLNEYANSPKTINITTKYKIANDITKVELYEYAYNPETYSFETTGTLVGNLEIETINNNKYAVYNWKLDYTNTPNGKPINNDIYMVEFSPNKHFEAKLISKEKESSVKLYNGLDIITENEPYTYDIKYLNKYGQEYPSGGSGTHDGDKTYLTEEMKEFAGMYYIPVNTNKKDIYFQLSINEKQGDTIEIPNFGTLYYAGIEQANNSKLYIYKNSLDQLKEVKKPILFTAKTKTEYNLQQYIHTGYEFDKDVKEEEVTGTLNTEIKDLKVNMIFNGVGTAKFGATEIKSTDTLYKKLENGNKDLNKEDYKNLYISVFDIYVLEGEYKGNLNITFNVGAEYNGKEYVVGHLKNGLETEYFKGTVENGKVTITVDSLSPFMLSIVEKKPNNTENSKPVVSTPNTSIETPKVPTTTNKEKDNTPKTGVTATADIIGYVIVVTVLAGAGIVRFKTKNK